MSQTHFLPPQKLKITHKDKGYFLHLDGQKTKIAPPKRALPLSSPDDFIVLSDEEGGEIGVLKRLDSLDPDSREILGAWLEEIYLVTPILKILEVDREPLSGQVRWRVEIESSEGDEEATAPEKSGAVRLLRRVKSDAKALEAESRRELTFYLAGAEDIQSARYPQIFLTDVEGNRYEIMDCETLDLNSRRLAQQYF